eukprot:g2293.t1
MDVSGRAQVVLFGDSITQQSFAVGGWGARLADYYCRRADVLNRGYSGYNTKWALHLLPTLLPAAGVGTALPVRLLTVFFGANDAALPDGDCARQQVPVDDFKRNLRSIVDGFRKKAGPDLRVVMITPPPVHHEQRLAWQKARWGDKATGELERTNEAAGRYASACRDVATELGAGTACLDLWTCMQAWHGGQGVEEGHAPAGGGDAPWATLLSDGLHLSEAGNAFVFARLKETVERAFPELAVQPCAATGATSNSGSSSDDSLPHDFPWHDRIDLEDPARSFQ